MEAFNILSGVEFRSVPCLYPKDAWQEYPGAKLVFKEPTASDLPQFKALKIPCYNCIECRLNRSLEWATRCTHEASLHEENCFITLTFNDNKIPYDGNLDHKYFELFMKRLRKRFPEKKIRFYMCGEYGEGLNNPHYHACLFGFDFPDRVHWSTRDGVRLDRSATLEELWKDPTDGISYGYSTVGNVTFESAAYIARYVTKKINGDMAYEHYQVVNDRNGEIVHLKPEYTCMSRGGREAKGQAGGIGADWWNKYKSDLDKDFLTMRGAKMRPPKYYDALLHRHDPEEVTRRKKIRRKRSIDNPIDPARLEARRVIVNNRSKLLMRGLEKL